MFGALKSGFRSMASLMLVRSVLGELQPKRTLAASRAFLAAARLSCSNCYSSRFRTHWTKCNSSSFRFRFRYENSSDWEPIGSRIWEIDWYQNEWPWPLFRGRIKVTSTVALHLHYIWRWISRKTLEIEVWFQRTTNRTWHTGYRMATWPMTSHDFERSNSWPQYA